MNTFTKSETGRDSEIIFSETPFTGLRELLLTKEVLAIIVFLVLIFFSALTVVYDQEENRLLFSQLSSLQLKRDKLYVKWGQLLLEESTWSGQSRIQKYATEKLHMKMPNPKNIVIVQQ